MPKIVSDNGTMRARLITPGQGTSGYYSHALLEKSASKFDGAQVFWDHPTTTEESIRPERSLRDLAGKILPGTSKWEESGKDGAGIYANVEIFPPYREAVNDLGPHIGMSIRASGQGKAGKINGQNTTIIESLDAIQSVDFVTLAGRGGKPLQMFEAARAAGRAANNPQLQENEMTPDEIKKLVEAGVTAATAPLKQRALRGDALIEASRVLATVTLPEAVKQRVIDSVLREAIPVNAAGELDTVKFTEAVNAEAKREGAYVAGLTSSGRVTGMGTAAPVEVKEALKPEEINARSVVIFRRLGLSESAAKAAVRGRAA